MAYSYIKENNRFILMVHDNIALRMSEDQVQEMLDLCERILLREHKTKYPHAWDAAEDLCDNNFAHAIEWMKAHHKRLGMTPMEACDRGREQEIVQIVTNLQWGNFL
jgi:hypothetical protein